MKWKIIILLQFTPFFLFGQSVEDDPLIKGFERASYLHSNINYDGNRAHADSISHVDLINESQQTFNMLKDYNNLKYVTNINHTFPLDSLCYFKNLEWLDIMSNAPIPSCFANFKQLGFMSYVNPKLRKIPTVITNIESLKFLALGLDMRKIPSELAQLHQLKKLISLSLTIPNIREFPIEVCQLKNLRELRLEYNRFFHLPNQLTNLVNLHTLDISADIGNEQHIIILSKMNSLKVLELDIKKTRTILDKVKSLSFLDQLIIRGGKLSVSQKREIISLLPDVDVVYEKM